MDDEKIGFYDRLNAVIDLVILLDYLGLESSLPVGERIASGFVKRMALSSLAMEIEE